MSFVTSAPPARADSALIETNSARTSRQVYWVARGLQNVMGLPWWSSYPDEANMHWGLRVGPYLWELAADKKNDGKIIKNRLSEAEWWKPSAGPELVGSVTLPDTYIDYCAQFVMDLMVRRYKDVFKKEYHITLNNCQIFVKVLDHLMQNDGENSCWWNEPPFSKVTWKWTRDEWDRAKRLPNAHPDMDSKVSKEIRAHELTHYQPHVGISGPWAARRRKSTLSVKLPLDIRAHSRRAKSEISMEIAGPALSNLSGRAPGSESAPSLHGRSNSEPLTRWRSDKTAVDSVLEPSAPSSEWGTREATPRTTAISFQLPEPVGSPGEGRITAGSDDIAKRAPNEPPAMPR